mgnify:CR=1 FL=1
MLYLDNAATSYKKPAGVYWSMLKNTWKNSVNAGHGGHAYSIRGAAEILKTSEKLADLFHIKNPERIAFTQNATYALNMAIGGLLKNGGHAVVTQMEHNSVLRPVYYYGNYTIVKADRLGRIDPAAVEAAICQDTALIVCTHISNVCGTVQPIEEIGKIAQKHDIPFLVDAAQSAGCTEIDVKKMHIDMLAFSGHKGLLSPLGTGGLYVGDNISLEPVLFGGTGSYSESLIQPKVMPDLLQCGTLNTPAIMAMGAGVDYIRRMTPEGLGEKERRLAERFIGEILNMSNVTVYGLADGKDRNGTVAFNIRNMDSVETAQRLNDDFRICVRGGWHCAYHAHAAIGSEKEGAVRASFGAFDNMRSVEQIVDAVNKIAQKSV